MWYRLSCFQLCKRKAALNENCLRTSIARQGKNDSKQGQCGEENVSVYLILSLNTRY
jgi:hypothetical protein